MKDLTYTLLGDGASDRLLLHPIRWALNTLGVSVESLYWADFRHFQPKPRSLNDRAAAALKLYPAELLFVHRDAESSLPADRIAEIQAAIQGVAPHCVAVVPVRMTEAWLLHDETAIRRASGNPNGTVPLNLPSPAAVEKVPNPKDTLEKALLTASGLSGRRLDKLKTAFGDMRQRTAELISDFEPLRAAPAFAAFLDALEHAVKKRERSRPKG